MKIYFKMINNNNNSKTYLYKCKILNKININNKTLINGPNISKIKIKIILKLYDLDNNNNNNSSHIKILYNFKNIILILNINSILCQLKY